eukprot:TRINITY_DN35179_c0_g1_i1.p1 TRINITY_DN35179_c0_g1~~TRINITY_DN35179_c0_g1_i1.p1  ORF type:complete len:290 (+),score=43.09 TRINITY_DN35179_c0_g1_i1:118-987(+)
MRTSICARRLFSGSWKCLSSSNPTFLDTEDDSRYIRAGLGRQTALAAGSNRHVQPSRDNSHLPATFEASSGSMRSLAALCAEHAEMLRRSPAVMSAAAAAVAAAPVGRHDDATAVFSVLASVLEDPRAVVDPPALAALTHAASRHLPRGVGLGGMTGVQSPVRAGGVADSDPIPRSSGAVGPPSRAPPRTKSAHGTADGMPAHAGIMAHAVPLAAGGLGAANVAAWWVSEKDSEGAPASGALPPVGTVGSGMDADGGSDVGKSVDEIAQEDEFDEEHDTVFGDGDEEFV